MPKGGKRPGQRGVKGPRGPQKATVAKMLEKQAIRDEVRLRVSVALQGLIDAQIANAQGLKYLVARDPKTGKFERIGRAGLKGAMHIEVWEKDPSIAAFADLLNRAADKPTEHQETNVTLGLTEEVLARLDSWKARNRAQS